VTDVLSGLTHVECFAGSKENDQVLFVVELSHSGNKPVMNRLVSDDTTS